MKTIKAVEPGAGEEAVKEAGSLEDLAEVAAEGCDIGKALAAMLDGIEPPVKTPMLALAESMIDHFYSVLNYVSNQVDGLEA